MGKLVDSRQDDPREQRERGNRRLARRLVGVGLVEHGAIQGVLDACQRDGTRLDTSLIERGLLEESDLLRGLSELNDAPPVDVEQVRVDPEVLLLIPANVARRHLVLPLAIGEQTIELAMADPGDFVATDDVEFITGLRVEPRIAGPAAIERAVSRLYGGQDDASIHRLIKDITAGGLLPAEFEIVDGSGSGEVDLATLAEQGGAAPVVRLANTMIADAMRRDASDIHIEPLEDAVRVRYRIDGVLHKVLDAPKNLQLPLASRIKVMSRLNISETRRSQDGRIKLRVRLAASTRDIDLRVSTAPMIWGEKIVLRLLDPEKLMLDMTHLGFEPWPLRKFQEAIQRPHGIVLVTGPTGSGKTNTLYSALSTINSMDVNILTAEDPVEFNLPGVNQLPVRESIGVTFAAALRTFLRQDPDVILVGEIRDGETADIAVRAALTGHLVLSTLHTNDAPSTVSRLVDMGVESFLIGACLRLIAAQRLVRRLCKHCREKDPTDSTLLVEAGFEADEADKIVPYRAVGCNECHGTGYRGRIGLFEVMPISDEIQQAILAGASPSELAELARSQGMITLRESGLRKVANGITSIEEVLRETSE